MATIHRAPEERGEMRPCAACGGEIAPRQLYVMESHSLPKVGPLHVYCYGSHTPVLVPEERTWPT